jgi:APA family basic amino acid/polyamine antiporter
VDSRGHDLEGGATTAGLKRALTLRDATAINLGAIIGSGIFVVTGIAAGVAGPALFISILVAAAVSLLTALSLTDLSRSIAREGGVYAYAYEYIVVSFFTLFNYIGAKDSAWLNNILVMPKMSILVFFIVFGALFINAGNLTPIQPLQGGVLLGAFYIFFAFGGFARITTLSEEVDDPLRNVPRAIMLSLAISTVFYILVGTVAIGMVGPSGLASSSSPLEFAMRASKDNAAVTVVIIGGLLATSSVMLTSILGVSRIEYSMALNKEFPRAFARLNGSSGIPYVAVMATGAAILVLALTGDIVSVIAIATFSQLFYYALTNVSAARLVKGGRKYRPYVPALGAISCLGMLVLVLFISPWAGLGGIICLGVGSLMFFIMKARRQQQLDG